MAGLARRASSYVPQKSPRVVSAIAVSSGFANPSSSRSFAWKTKASASVNAVLGTPSIALYGTS